MSHFNFLVLIVASLTLQLKELPFSASHYHEKRIQVRGFWYPLSENQGVLAPYPHLKSCCIGSLPSLGDQIFVTGEVNQIATKQPVTLQGLFKIAPQYDNQGKIIQFYVLEQAQFIQNSPYLSIFWSFFILLLASSLMVYKKYLLKMFN